MTNLVVRRCSILSILAKQLFLSSKIDINVENKLMMNEYVNIYVVKFYSSYKINQTMSVLLKEEEKTTKKLLVLVLVLVLVLLLVLMVQILVTQDKY